MPTHSSCLNGYTLELVRLALEIIEAPGSYLDLGLVHYSDCCKRSSHRRSRSMKNFHMRMIILLPSSFS